jgi:hypothetical protein
MWLDEEGKFADNVEPNFLATDIAHEARAIQAVDWVAGTVVLTGDDGRGESTGFTAEQITQLCELLQVDQVTAAAVVS